MTNPIDLDHIETPHQLRRMSNEQLAELAKLMRKRIVDVVSAKGGHLASNLGTIELTIALHHVFDFSHDRLLFDVGHQCYPHKLLTGRAPQFDTLRQAGGISGFPNPAESPYDLFATGHAGTAISTAAGLAMGDQYLSHDSKVVALVGDASIVNGLSLEGLNNAALLKRQFLVVLNDNSMAIDRTRGALAEALDAVRMMHSYADLKTHTEQMLSMLPLGAEITDALRHVREGLRTTLHGPKVFETLGFGYFGPVNGHDIPSLIKVLQRVSQMDRPVVLHVHTEKGRGCAYAVDDPCRFHSPAAYTIQDEKPVFRKGKRPSWTQAFATVLKKQASQDQRIVAITAAMPDGTGLASFREEFPDRTIDVGISESHAVACAAGLSKAGMRPVVAIYSTFMQRAFDQVFHELALQKLPCVICMDRAGLVGSDGAVHHGFADISYLRILPGMTVCAPADEAELVAAMDFALAAEGPVAIRYPRDEVPEPLAGPCPPFAPGQSRLLREGGDATIFAYGSMVASALEVAELLATEGIDVAVINARFAKPLDTNTVARRLSGGKPFLVLEDHARIGGLASAVLELAAERGLNASHVRGLGIPDRFISAASRHQQLEEVGLDVPNIAQTLRDMLAVRTVARPQSERK